MPDTTLHDLLSPRARAWVYVVLSISSAMYAVADVAYTMPGWVPIIVAGVNATGFVLARSHTPAGEPPPDLLRDRGDITLRDIALVLAICVLALILLRLI